MSLDPRAESALFAATLEASLAEARARHAVNPDSLDARVTRLENICVATVKMVNEIVDSLAETQQILARVLRENAP